MCAFNHVPNFPGVEGVENMNKTLAIASAVKRKFPLYPNVCPLQNISTLRNVF
jgi:3-hydroxymyristoyl/3-hydroxydecanoyl-(acyl carrier protein) dehydratase